MSLDGSGISWTDGTLNSLYGCSEVSPGCRACYARNNIHRKTLNSRANPDGRYDGLVNLGKQGQLRFTGKLMFQPAHLYAALKDRTGKMIFTNEFSDLYHAAVPDEIIQEHFRVFKAAGHHQYQILTKRGERLETVDRLAHQELGSWPANVWQGVSVCSAASSELRRIEQLSEVSARHKFISFEPWISGGIPLRQSVPNLAEVIRSSRADWIIVGGESGSRIDAALMTLDDARFLLEAGRAARVAVHFKQTGTALAVKLGIFETGRHRAKGGDPTLWPDDLQIREWPQIEWQGYNREAAWFESLFTDIVHLKADEHAFREQ